MTSMDRTSQGVAVTEPPGHREEGIADFEAFFDAEHRGLYSALVLITHDRHEAEELMQDAFLKLWERWGRVGAMDDPAGYLFRTAMNLFRTSSGRWRSATPQFARWPRSPVASEPR